MTTKNKFYFNEPIRIPKGDIIPKLKPVRKKSLGPFVVTRLELEKNLRICGLAKEGELFKVTPTTRKVLNFIRNISGHISIIIELHVVASCKPKTPHVITTE